MGNSLTVLMPVHNAQSTLGATVLEALEVVSELTGRFELLIIDDGSEDATSEVAWELCRSYPQVRAIRHGRHLGPEAALRTGLSHSRGEVVVFRDERGGVALEEIRRMWLAAEQGEIALDAADGLAGPNWSLSETAASQPAPGYRLAERHALERLAGCSRPARPNYLARLRSFALGQ